MQITFNKDSTERSLRTGYHYLIGLIGAVPAIVLISHDAGLDRYQFVVTSLTVLGATTTGASKVINALEERGLIPAFLKTPNVAVIPPEPTDADPSATPTVSDQVGPISEADHDGPLADRDGNLAPAEAATPPTPAPVVPPVPEVSPTPAVPPTAP